MELSYLEKFIFIKFVEFKRVKVEEFVKESGFEQVVVMCVFFGFQVKGFVKFYERSERVVKFIEIGMKYV